MLLDEVEEAVALGHRRVVGEVPGVERREVVAAQIAPVRFRLGVGVAGELERGVREDGPVLQEGGRELGIQLGPRVVRQQLAGHVALRLGLGVVVRQIHVPQRIGNLLIDFGPGVEIQQSRDDLGIDLAAVVVAGQGRGDGRGHRAAGGV